MEVKGNDIEISDQDSKFLYKNVDTIRYKTGDQVKTGDIIGKVSPKGNQTVYYQKLEPDRANQKDKDGKVKKSWTYVNVGFYFQHVEYTQATSVVSDIKTSGDKGKIRFASVPLSRLRFLATSPAISVCTTTF